MSTTAGEFANVEPIVRLQQQRAWNWFDWANSGFYTTVLTVMFAPYMITVAGKAAGCADADDSCTKTVNVLGLHLAAGSLPAYITTFATIVSAFLLPIVGAFVDRSSHKKWNMSGFAFAGSFFCMLLFFLRGESWQLGAVAVVLASVCGGCSLVAYYAILVDISTEEERDNASSRGWAWGYLGGGLLLVVNLVMFELHSTFGLSKSMSVRLSFLTAGIWWAAFTLIPLVKLRNYPARNLVEEQGKSLLQRSFGQLFTTLREVRTYPMTLTFLVAYLFYNDGIQTVIYEASTFGEKTLKMSTTVMIATILIIQFVAWGGALFFGRLAARYGAYRSILYGCITWMVIVVAAFFLPAHNVPLFLLIALAIGIVLGGTQALSRSFFSLLIPRGREGEYFALYNACERGTSWFGTLVFAVTFQVWGSYRYSIFALIVFFVLGTLVLTRLDPKRGIEEAGNALPSVV